MKFPFKHPTQVQNPLLGYSHAPIAAVFLEHTPESRTFNTTYSQRNMNIRVCIFEDNQLVRNALETILNGTTGLSCIGAFASANRWHLDLARNVPDVILMDIEMPGISGIEATRAITEKYPDIKILIQTVFLDNDKIFEALCAGASGYMLKNDPPHKLIEAIHDVYTGGAPLSSSVAKKMLGFFAHQNVILVSPGTNDYQLSDRERELLQMIVKGDNYKTIAEKAFISYETVRTHVKHIYKKLHVTSRNEAMMKAIQHGLT